MIIDEINRVQQSIESKLQICTHTNTNNILIDYNDASNIHEMLTVLKRLTKTKQLCLNCKFSLGNETCSTIDMSCKECEQYSKEQLCCKCTLVKNGDVCIYFEPNERTSTCQQSKT